MTFISWDHGTVVRIPSSWTIFTIDGVVCKRMKDGSVRCQGENGSYLVTSWQVFKDEPPVSAEAQA